MTTPAERTRHLVQTRAFLKELRANASLPESICKEANRLLRHYPSLMDLELLAGIEACSVLGSHILTPHLNSEWTKGYK